MTILLIVGLGLLAAALSLLGRRGHLAAALVASLGLVLLLAALAVSGPNDALTVGGDRLVLSGYTRLLLGLGAAGGLVLTLLGLATAGGESLPGAMPMGLPVATLAALGALAVALTVREPLVAAQAAAAAAAAGLLVSVRTIHAPRAIDGLRRELRVVAVAAALIVLGVGWASSLVPAALPASLPAGAVGAAYLAVAAAVALRAGAIPFHAWVTRLAATAPRPALALLLVWLPAGLLLVAIEWSRATIAPLGLPLDLERGTVIGVGILGILLGALGATLQGDVVLLVAYSVIQDAGFGLLALGTFDPAAWAAARTWLLVFLATKTALVGWLVALQGEFGSSRLDELGGWARRSPPLALALLAIVAATVGWPGLVVFEARDQLLRLTVREPLHTVALLGSLASLVYYGRLGAAGLARMSPLVEAAGDWRPRRVSRPAPLAAAPPPTTELGDLPHSAPASWDRRLAALERGLAHAEESWRGNRAPVAATLVLLMGLSALVVASDGLDLGRLAAEAPSAVVFEPGPSEGPGPSSLSGSPAPSVGPAGSVQPPAVAASPQPLATE